jgi:hypothetical protein
MHIISWRVADQDTRDTYTSHSGQIQSFKSLLDCDLAQWHTAARAHMHHQRTGALYTRTIEIHTAMTWAISAEWNNGIRFAQVWKHVRLIHSPLTTFQVSSWCDRDSESWACLVKSQASRKCRSVGTKLSLTLVPWLAKS